MSIGQSLRAGLASITPTWLQNFPSFRNLFETLWTVALLGDALREIALEGRYAAFPGLGTPTALPYIGASRGLLQGPGEPDASFAARCIDFRTTNRLKGSPEQLALQIQAYLCGQGTLGAGVYPVVRIVDRDGNTTTANADRTVTFGQISWDWDEVGGFIDTQVHTTTQVSGWHSDEWILIQDFTTHYTGFGDPNWLAAWGSGDQTLGGLCPQAIVQGVLSLVGEWKGAHIWERTVALVPDPTTFTPNGKFGNASKNIGGTQTATRTASNGYWDIPDGA